jgi:outer membrane protein assembly factor BamB
VIRVFVVATVVAVLAGCGGKAAFNLTAGDNDPALLGKALGRRQLPSKAQPLGGAPRVYAVVAGKPRKIVAFDLASGKALWTVDADAQSRIAVGGDYVAALEGTEIVAREATTGAVRWKKPVGGAFVGVAADAKGVYVVRREDGTTRPTWWLTALDARSGSQKWSADAAGQLGQPVAHGGLVLSPFLTQWLSIVDADTGVSLTRIRGIEAQISFVRATSDGAWFGSAQGVFRLDDRAASGTKAGSTFGKVELPKQVADATYGVDAFDPVQAAYTASDRRRILWRAPATGGDKIAFDTGVAVHYFRFVFGFSATGQMQWAYSHPRVELVASDHLGNVIAAVSAGGDVVALDPATGALRGKQSIGASGQVLGATFDADGWAPSGAGDPPATVAALVAIARDRDARFDKVKELAVVALSKLSGANVTADLLTILDDDRASQKLKDAVVDVLISRKDPSGAPALAAALVAQRTDWIDGKTAQNVGAIAKVVASLDRNKIDEAVRAELVAALIQHLDAPDTELADVIAVARALVVVGSVEGAAALRTHLMIYRGDSELAGSLDWRKAVVDGLVARNSPIDLETVRFVSTDPHTDPELAGHARDAIAR